MKNNVIYKSRIDWSNDTWNGIKHYYQLKKESNKRIAEMIKKYKGEMK